MACEVLAFLPCAIHTCGLCHQSVSAASLGPKSSALLILEPTELAVAFAEHLKLTHTSVTRGRPGERIARRGMFRRLPVR